MAYSSLRYACELLKKFMKIGLMYQHKSIVIQVRGGNKLEELAIGKTNKW
jgi:hypothetical protein